MKDMPFCESTGELAKIVNSSKKRVIAYEQSTIQYEQTYKLLKSNLLSLTVEFDRIDGSHNKDNILKKWIYSHLTVSWKHAMNVKVRTIGYLIDADIANSQGRAWSKINLSTIILQSKVPSVGIDRIITAIIAIYRPDLTSQQTSSGSYMP